MSRFTVNNKPIQDQVTNDLTINELMDIIQDKYAGEDEFFTEVLLDGKPIAEAEEAELLDTSIEKYGKIDFTLRNTTELAFDALDTCTGHLDTLIEKVQTTAESYRENKIDLGNQQFIEITEILDLFIELVTTIHHTLNIKSETELNSGKTLQELEIHLLSVLKALVPAKEKGDVIMLCDLLEYELIDNLTQWKISAIPELKRLKTI